MAIHQGFTSVNAVGVTGTAGASSAQLTLPTMASGAAPKAVRVQTDGYAFVKFGASGVVATTNDMLISPNMPEYVVCGGATTMAYIQSTAACKVNVVPLES